MAQNLCRNIEVAHGQVEHDGEVVQVARSGGPIRHNFDGTVQGSPRACLAGRQVAHTGGPCGSCRRRGRTERAHRALENAARFPRASTGLSTSDHPRQTPEEPRVLLGNPDRPVFRVYQLAAVHNAPVFTHVREGGISAIQEVLSNAAITGAPLHIVHINSMVLGDISVALEMVASAQAEGLDVTTEVYPYTAASTYLQSAMFDPGWQERIAVLR